MIQPPLNFSTFFARSMLSYRPHGLKVEIRLESPTPHASLRPRPMPELSQLVASSLAGYYEEVRLHQWVAPISTEQLWRKPYPYGSSVGHVLLHLTGNLNYNLVAHVAPTGYVRVGDREFNELRKLPKEQVL